MQTQTAGVTPDIYTHSSLSSAYDRGRGGCGVGAVHAHREPAACSRPWPEATQRPPRRAAHTLAAPPPRAGEGGVVRRQAPRERRLEEAGALRARGG